MDVQPMSALDEPVRDALFARFVELYDREFPDPQERAEPEAWLGPFDADGAAVELVFAGTGFDEPGAARLAGGTVLEYYPESECGLLAYIAVDPGARGAGVARKLLDRSAEALMDMATARGGRLKGLFAETEDFRHPEVHNRTGMDPARRVDAHHRLGGRWIPIQYTAPRISADVARDEHLLLFVFPHPLITTNALTLDARCVQHFLKEYYATEEPADDPSRAPLLARMSAELEDLARDYHQAYVGEEFRADQPHQPLELTYLPSQLRPVLKLHEIAVCLHFLEHEAGSALPADAAGAVETGQAASEPVCPIYHSFETDILSYRFQFPNLPPVQSACLDTPDPQFRVEVEFDRDEIEYMVEGMLHTKVGRGAMRKRLRTVVTLTSSYFPSTGVRVWHLALQPEFGEYFDEFDVIRLLSFYYHQQEQTRSFLHQVRFRVTDSAGARSDPQTLFGLICALLPDHGPQLTRESRPLAGTIELDPCGGGAPANRDRWTRLMQLLASATDNDYDAMAELKTLYEDSSSEGFAPEINALCGIVSATFDHTQMNFAEAMDTLVMDSYSGDYSVWFNRATLSNLSLIGTMLDRCGRTIGISPYLSIPHAVLLHNEHIIDTTIDAANATLNRVGTLPRKPDKDSLDAAIAELADARRNIERTLYSDYVPNVFEYEGEREIYEAGSRKRGALEQKENLQKAFERVQARLRDFQALHEELLEDEQAAKDRAQQADDRLRDWFVLVLTFLFLLSVLFDASQVFEVPRHLLIGGSVVILAAMGIMGYLFRPRRTDHPPAD